MWVHYTRDATRADYASAAFGTSLHLRSDGFGCGACAEQWGWHDAPSPTTTCCSKRRARRRAPPPVRRGAARHGPIYTGALRSASV